MSNYGWVTIEKLLSSIFAIASIILLPKYISPNDFGLIAVIMVFINIGNVLIDSGLGGAIIRKDKASSEDYSTVYFYNILTSVTFYIFIWFLSPSVAKFYDSEQLVDLIRVSSIGILISSLYLIDVLELTKKLEFKIQSIFNLISRFIAFCFSLLLAINNYGYWSISISLIIGHLVLLLCYRCHNRKMHAISFSLDSFKELIPFGIRLSASGIIRNIYINVLPSVIAKFFGISAAGYYSQANKFNDILLRNIISILDKVSFPVFAKLDEKDINSKTLELYSGVMYFVAPCLILLSLIASDLINFILGDQWAASAWFLTLLCYSGLGLCIESVSRNIIKSRGYAKEILWSEVVKIVMLFLVLIAAAYQSIRLVLYCFVVITVVNFLINMIIIHIRLNVSFLHQIQSIIKPMLLSSLTAAIISSIDFPDINHFISLLFVSFSYLVLYIFGFFIFGGEFRKYLKVKK